MTLNPVHLRTLIAVIRTGSFADAARRLGYTGSAVSQQIAALERAVKMPLFERDARSIRATATAELLASRAHLALAGLDSLGADVQEMAQGTLGRVRIGSFPTASRSLLPMALATFKNDFPNVEILLDEAETKELVGLLQDGEIDLTLVYHYDLVPRQWPRELRRYTLLTEDLTLLLPREHRFVDLDGLQLADLEDEIWISTREGTAGTQCLRHACATAGFEPIIDFRTNDYDAIRAFVRAGLGIALVPALGHVESDGVVSVRIDDLKAQRHVVALHRPGNSNAAVAAVLAAVEAAAALMIAEIDMVSAPT